MDRIVRAWAPASLSNLGPGFDALGLALEGIGDMVEASWFDGPGVRVTVGLGEAVPLDPDRNTAARAAMALLGPAGDRGIHLVIHKGIRPGSGLGSSAASAVAAAWAVARLMGGTVDKESLVGAALDGESAVSGSRHGDNVLPSLFGGIVLMTPNEPSRYRSVSAGAPMFLTVIRPDIRILTREARAILPAFVSLADAVRNAASLAFLIDALRCGDLETVGAMVERDLLVEPVRARLVAPYDAVRRAARDAGALGCALSGSGPAMFSLAGDAEAAERVREAMEWACRSTGVACVSFTSTLDPQGARDARPDDPRVEA